MTATNNLGPAPRPAAPEPPRDRWGRPKIRQADGSEVGYTRCTTFIDVLDDKHNLTKWRMRMLTGGLATRADLRLRAAPLAEVLARPHYKVGKGCSCGAELTRHGNCPEEKKAKRTLDQVCDDAIEAFAASARANVGSAFHDYADMINRGVEPMHVPAEIQPALASYRDCLRAHKIRVHRSEVFVVQDELQVGGTFDALCEIEGLPGLVIGDIKTGASTLEYGMTKVAMQLAMYANCQAYNIETGERTPLGTNTEVGVVMIVDVAQGTTELHWVDLRVGWQLCQLAGKVREARKLSPYGPWEQLFQPLLGASEVEQPATPATAAWALAAGLAPTATELLVTEAARVATLEELDLMWNEGQRHGTWTDAMTRACQVRAGQLQAGGQGC